MGRVYQPSDAPVRFGDVPLQNGLVFVCRHCNRPYALSRDTALRAWGERGRVQVAGSKLRCRNCGHRGLRGYLAPSKAELGSPDELTALVERLRGLRPKRQIE